MEKGERRHSWLEDLRGAEHPAQTVLLGKMSIVRPLVPILLIFLSIPARAATYYVSHQGNDASNGTSPAQAWRSIVRLQQHMNQLQPGDQVLFERGGTYPGLLSIYRSGTAAQPIVFGAYGSGEKPIISGAVPVTGWTRHQGDIWRASFTGNAKYLFVGNQPMTLARHPNTGWLRNVQGSTTSINAGSALGQANGHWTGATVVVRSTNWSYENAVVTGFSNGTLTFQPILVNLSNEDWGFFLQNKLNMLDAPGEWYHDQGTGHVYLWAPGNADPNTLSIQASIHDRGFAPGWQQQHIRIQDLCFQGQTASAVSTETSHHVTVTGCTFRHVLHAISSTGTNHRYTDNEIHDTYGTAIRIFGESNTMVAGNTLTDIAVRPGMGEPWWGYIGIRVTGQGNEVRDNRLNNVGYIGILAEGRALVERNVIEHATSILNDGAGIAFDHCDGLVIRENIVLDMDCDLTSVATKHISYYKIGFGIYFGNTSIRNTLVERNTVARCDGAGVHVDHTKVSQGNVIRDNVLFDNGIQLSLSDMSNTTGPGAAPPYHVPEYDDVYTGNVLYSVRPGQLIMRHYNVYSANPVRFGTFTDNRYFSPYDEVGIFIFNTFSGKKEHFTLEQWQDSRGTDHGTRRSPLRMSRYRVDQVLTPNMVPNGTFDNGIQGWTGWPTETSLTRSDSLLDNGALRLHFLNTNGYHEHFLNPDQWGTLQEGEMYRFSFSIQSDLRGQLRARVRGQAQWNGPYSMWEQVVPFDSERRDLEFFIRSDRSEPGRVQFVNYFGNDRRYWLDNVKLERVMVTPLDPYDDHKLFVNDSYTARNFPLPDGCWSDVDGVFHSGSIELAPFRSRVLYRVPPGNGCGVPTSGSVDLRLFLGGALDVSTGLMRSTLAENGLLPTSEPYTALGFAPDDPGAIVAPELLEATGAEALVDWVLLELRGNDTGFPLIERRVALLRADGQVISNTGSFQVPFQNDVEGTHLVVRHRNHLPVMTAAALLSNGQRVDLRTPGVALYGQEPAWSIGAQRALWPGDVNGDGRVRYSGAGNDRDPVLVAIGSEIPSLVEQGYLMEDVNLDGLVKYTGARNDRDIILSTIGGVMPTAVRVAQVP